MRMCRVAAWSAILVLGACSKQPAPSAFTAPKPAPPVEAPPAPVAEVSPVPKDLPPFGATAGADPAKAAEILQEAEAIMDQGAEPEPGDEQWNQVLLAVKTDPGSPRARVVVARMVNDDAFTAAQLAPLATATDCAACADALLNIDVASWPAAEPIVAKITPSPQRRVVDAIRGFIDSGDKATIAPFFKAKKVTITTECLSCELSGEGDTGNERKATGAKTLAMLVGLKQDDNLFALGGWYCAKDCCSATDALNGTPNGNTFVSTICFAPGTDQVTSLVVFD